MANFIIQGGKEITGEIAVSGSKNSTLPALAASLLFQNPIEFKNIPQIEDIFRMQELMSSIEINHTLDSALVRKFRGSVLAIGPYVARFGLASFPHPGGCKIGARPIDMFIHGWEAMGARCFIPPRVERGDGLYSVDTTSGLMGCDYAFRVSSVTGTESMIMTAVLATGTTILRNCAKEPEVIALADFLNNNGAKISGVGTSEITIEGRGGKLLDSNVPFVAPPDRIEAGSFILLGALTSPKLVVRGCILSEQKALIDVLDRAGVSIDIRGNEIAVSKPSALRPFHIRTEEFPGFPTDLQAPATIPPRRLTALMGALKSATFFKWIPPLPEASRTRSIPRPPHRKASQEMEPKTIPYALPMISSREAKKSR